MAAPATTIRRLATITLALVALGGAFVLAGFPVRPAAAVEAPALVPTTAPAPVPPGSTVSYGPDPDQVMDLWRPDPAAFPGPRPVVLFVHAGGWIAGDRTGVPEVVLAQVGRGYAVASIDYQLATTDADGAPVGSFPAPVWDVKRAVRFLKATAGEWDLNPRRVVLLGVSAGGHLAALVAATPGELEPPEADATAGPKRDSSVAGVVDMVGPTDLTTFPHTAHAWAAPLTAAFLGCPAPTAEDPATCAPAQLEQASVATFVDRSDPPILLAYGALDELVVPATQGEPLLRAWRDAHGDDPASASYLVVETAGHNLPFEDTVGPVASFLDRVTGTTTTVRFERDDERPVVLYGDSLASEAQAHFTAALQSSGLRDVRTRTFGGTAVCDWFDEMQTDADALRPGTVVLEFSGNALTPCMGDERGAPLRGDAYFEKYVDDAREAMRIFAATDTRVVFAGAPVSRRDAEQRNPDAGRLNALYASLAAAGDADYVDAGAAVLDRGRWTATLACLPSEPCSGATDASGATVNPVRAPDGTHFCPSAPEAVNGVTGECAVWSSGAFRFGTAMAGAVLGSVHPPSPRSQAS